MIEVVIEGLKYRIDLLSKNAVVIENDVQCAEIELIIPQSILYNGNSYPVVEIDDMAFFNWYSLIYVTIPKGVTRIGARAFKACYSLRYVTLPDGLLNIEDEAFYGCDLDGIEIPDSVITLGDCVFGACECLYFVLLRKGLTEIGAYVFAGCNQLSWIDFDGTINQWQQIKLDCEWDMESHIKTIRCTDSDLTI